MVTQKQKINKVEKKPIDLKKIKATIVVQKHWRGFL